MFIEYLQEDFIDSTSFFLMFIFEKEVERVCYSGEENRERRGQRTQSGLCTDSSEPIVRLELTNHDSLAIPHLQLTSICGKFNLHVTEQETQADRIQ